MPTTNSAYGSGNKDNYCDENSINKSNMFNNFARYITQSSLPLKQLIKKTSVSSTK